MGEQPRVPAVWLRLILFLLCGALASLAVIVVAVGGLWAQHPGSTPQDLLDQYPLPLACATLVPFAVVALGFARWVDRRPLSELGLSADRQTASDLTTGMAFGVLAVGLVWLALLGCGTLRLAGGPTASVTSALVVALFFGLQSFAEEVVVRGYLLGNLLDRWSPLAAVVATSVFFSVAHLGNEAVAPLALLNILLVGLVLGWTRIRTGRLWAAFGLHWGWNLALAGLSLPVSGCRLAGLVPATLSAEHAWLHGGDFGPEGGLAGTAAALLLAAAVTGRLREVESAERTKEVVADLERSDDGTTA